MALISAASDSGIGISCSRWRCRMDPRANALDGGFTQA
jgi:hypothetical protein